MKLEIPIKCCHVCDTSYTLTEWTELTCTIASDTSVESRWCSCGHALELDRDGLAELALERDVERYAHDFPASGRPMAALRRADRDSGRRTRYRRVAGLLGLLVLMLACCAYVLMGTP